MVGSHRDHSLVGLVGKSLMEKSHPRLKEQCKKQMRSVDQWLSSVSRWLLVGKSGGRFAYCNLFSLHCEIIQKWWSLQYHFSHSCWEGWLQCRFPHLNSTDLATFAQGDSQVRSEHGPNKNACLMLSLQPQIPEPFVSLLQVALWCLFFYPS